MRLLVIRNDGKGIPQVIEQPAGTVFHHGNLQETSTTLTSDSLTSPDDSALKVLASWNDPARPKLTNNQLVSYKVDLAQGHIVERTVLQAGQEFPRFNALPAVVRLTSTRWNAIVRMTFPIQR